MYTYLNVYFFLLMSVVVNGIQVNTTEGMVEGRKAGDGNYHVFYGIPYAGPAEGNNRFRAPVPPQMHTGIFKAIDSNVICAQPSDRGQIGVENCLTLSIFTNNVTTVKPVIVWLNSEDFTNTLIQPFSFKTFVEEDIVFVSLNFRLSVFGFLCLGVAEAPGNAGLRDIIQGLKWINSNIANFGGNPKNVVLMGHDSGAALVDILTMSPQIEGLFHKAIALSGSSLSPWAIAYDPVGYASILGAKLGYAGKSKRELAKRLVTTDITVLNAALEEFKFKNNTLLFAPCIENNASPNDTVLADAPIRLLKNGDYMQIPYIAVYTTMEGTMRAREAITQNWLADMQANFSNFLQVDLNLGANKASVAEAVKEFYFSKSTISMENIKDYLDYQGDVLVVVPVIRAARERGLTSISEVRLMEFAYLGTFNSDWLYNQIPLDGVRHGGLLNYLFDYDLKPNDDKVKRTLLKQFVSFAYTGSPNPSPRVTINWRAITKDKLYYFYFGGSDNVPICIEEARYNPHNLIMDFWNNIILNYYQPPTPLNSSTTFAISSIIVYGFFLFLMLAICS